MSDFNWCHGPECHEKHTVDRVRGVKGSKVLRTRKIKVNPNYSNSSWQWFCSNHCERDFWNKYGNEIRQIAPRTECLETPIHDPKREAHNTTWGYKWYDTKIEVDETRQT